MYNSEHLSMIMAGVRAWNKWRDENPDILPDLSDADLRGANLSGAHLHRAVLSGADLSEADLSEAHLSWAVLSEADLSWAHLSGAVLSGANLGEANLHRARLSGANLGGANLRSLQPGVTSLRGAFVNQYTLYPKKRGFQVGVNGLYCEVTMSAALMTSEPPGNSMLGSNPDAVAESLKRARRLHGFSMSLVGIVVLIALSEIKTGPVSTIPFPYARDFKISVEIFGLLAMLMSTGLLSIANSFMSDALKGARYLRTRESAMSIGNFPWTLSRFARKADSSAHTKAFIKILANGLSTLQSFLTRIVMSFHPVVYWFFIERWGAGKRGDPHIPDLFQFGLHGFNNQAGPEYPFNMDTLLHIFAILLVILGVWTFILSQRFQKPILFDPQTERERQSDLERLASAVEKQTALLGDFRYLLEEPKQESTRQAESSNENH